ncbi:hypothetical protein Sjap_014217 [Stephania japonica]|uniref:mannosyl-glycoprotein endo-beta-N-acetylglucosaminidase n=1 Tax=Stephania japonica TaxID=461633 RepID=A0AAP0P0R2_9MAGN
MRTLLRSLKNHQTLVSARSFLRYLSSIVFPRSRSPSMDPVPEFDPLEPSVPVSYPIKELEDLKSRSYFKSFHYPFNRASVELPPGSVAAPDRGRILVCHDMAGGYLDDRWIQGGGNEGAYAIWHWYLIDVFVYFSHNLVTIPPPCWTNAAHKHGVKVLGTFITEWEKGRAICDKLLSTKESAQMYAERLTELAASLGFDGWLINIEVNLDAGQIPYLKEFVSHLSQTMHSTVPGSLVIWYDSVTINGDLSWQDQLNDKNKPFFDLCDGIFVNYTWQEDYPKLSAAVAGDRKFDVYMGIDVFGRNTYGGGQWNTNVALDVLKKDDVSAAIFAPGWVYETKQPPDFQTAQNRWWGLVEKSWGLVQFYPKVLPFYSNFDQGHGYHFSVDGRQISNNPWCNISLQGFQKNLLGMLRDYFLELKLREPAMAFHESEEANGPILDNSGNSSTNTIKVLVNFEEASYSGGANITFKGNLKKNASFMMRLFQGELPLGDLPVFITYSVKSKPGSLLGLSLKFISEGNNETSFLLASSDTDQFADEFDKVIVPHEAQNLKDDVVPMAPGWIIQDSSIMMKGQTLTEIRILCYNPKHQSENTESAPDTSDYYASLGHITIRRSSQNPIFPSANSWVVNGQNISWSSGSQGTKTLSINIVWSLVGRHDKLFSGYNIYFDKVKSNVNGTPEKIGETKYLGVARVKAFYITKLVVPAGTSSLRFIIQVCGADGTCQTVDSSPAMLLAVQD